MPGTDKAQYTADYEGDLERRAQAITEKGNVAEVQEKEMAA